MSRKYKNIIAMFLVVIMCFSINAEIFAKVFYEDDATRIVMALNAIEPIKNELELSEVDFGKLTYSDSIMAYDYTEEGIVYNAEYIPILYNGELTGWVIKTPEGIYQFSTAFVNEINNINIGSNGFALLYSYDAVYVYDGCELFLLAPISVAMENRAILKNVADLKGFKIVLNHFDQIYNLQYTTNSNMRAANYYSCNVSYVTQRPYENLCWAATTASIVNYLKGRNITAETVARTYLGSNFDVELAYILEPSVLNMFGVNNYTYGNRVPSNGVILNNIQSGYPIMANFQHSSGGHIVALYGINVTGGYLYVMDPYHGFCSTTYSASAGHTYYWPNGGATYTFGSATCRYWTS